MDKKVKKLITLEQSNDNIFIKSFLCIHDYVELWTWRFNANYLPFSYKDIGTNILSFTQALFGWYFILI